MALLADSSDWSLAPRRDTASSSPAVAALNDALAGADVMVTMDLLLQELLQRFFGAQTREQIVDAFGALALIRTDREDHNAAAMCETPALDLASKLQPWTHGLPNHASAMAIRC